MTLADRILSFNKGLKITSKLPSGVEVLNPFQNPDTFHLCTLFYHKFYNDNNTRLLIIGINPGRFGAGLTGIPFTDPIKLEERCGIQNMMPKKAELSADFMYKMFDALGGPQRFFSKFYISSVSPLGFIKDGKNLNYYDSKELEKTVTGFAVDSLQKQLEFGLNREICFCLGEGKNFSFLNRLNEKYRFFQSIVPLPHPRFIMQYKRKRLSEYIHYYVTQLGRSSV
jgi:hypothetical protein